LPDLETASLEFLGGLVELRELSIGEQPGPVDARPLEHLTQLTDLTLGGVLDDVQFLRVLANLERLQLKVDRRVADLSPLQGASQLRSLWLDDYGGVDVKHLAGCQGLRRLTVRRASRLRTLGVALPNLQKLDCHKCSALVSVDVASFPALESLELSFCRALETVKSPEAASKLSTVDIGFSGLHHVGAFSACAELKTLEAYMEDAKLEGVRELLGCPMLKKLVINPRSIDSATQAAFRAQRPGVLNRE
jgi:hypothetical protein